MFIHEGDQVVSETYMTRVEGENTRLRYYLARLHCKTLCYSRVPSDADLFAPFAASLLEVSDSSSASLVHYSFSNAENNLLLTQNLITGYDHICNMLTMVVLQELCEDRKSLWQEFRLCNYFKALVDEENA